MYTLIFSVNYYYFNVTGCGVLLTEKQKKTYFGGYQTFSKEDFPLFEINLKLTQEVSTLSTSINRPKTFM